MDRHTTTTMIRARAHSDEADQAITSVAFLTGCFFVDSNTQLAYLDTTSIEHMTNWSYTLTDPAIFNTSVHGSGIVCGQSYELDDESVLLPVKLTVYLLNDIKSFRVMYNDFDYFAFTR